MFEKNYQITMEGSMDMVKVLHMYAQSTLPLAPCSCQAQKEDWYSAYATFWEDYTSLGLQPLSPLFSSYSKSILIPH